MSDHIPPPEIVARLDAWKDAAPGREVSWDVAINRGENATDATWAATKAATLAIMPRAEVVHDDRHGEMIRTHMVMLVQQCTCGRQPRHPAQVFIDPLTEHPDAPRGEWHCLLTDEGEAVHRKNEQWMADLQRRLDRLRPSQRRARIAKLERRSSLPPSQMVELIALRENVSALRAFELLHERMADGSLQATARIGSRAAPREVVPPALFRTSH